MKSAISIEKSDLPVNVDITMSLCELPFDERISEAFREALRVYEETPATYVRIIIPFEGYALQITRVQYRNDPSRKFEVVVRSHSYECRKQAFENRERAKEILELEINALKTEKRMPVDAEL